MSKAEMVMVHNHGGGVMGPVEPRILPNSEFDKKYRFVNESDKPSALPPPGKSGGRVVANDDARVCTCDHRSLLQGQPVLSRPHGTSPYACAWCGGILDDNAAYRQQQLSQAGEPSPLPLPTMNYEKVTTMKTNQSRQADLPSPLPLPRMNYGDSEQVITNSQSKGGLLVLPLPRMDYESSPQVTTNQSTEQGLPTPLELPRMKF